MYAVYVLEDTWRLRATFSTRDAANITPLALSVAASAPRYSAQRRDVEEGGMRGPSPAAGLAEPIFVRPAESVPPREVVPARSEGHAPDWGRRALRDARPRGTPSSFVPKST